jgi:hypothetical protein
MSAFMIPADHPPACTDDGVDRAGPADAGVLSQVIADAFFDLAVSQWLVPGEDARRQVFPGYFRIYVEHSLAGGLVAGDPPLDAPAPRP